MNQSITPTHIWGRWEGVFHSATPYSDSVNDVALTVQMVAPSGTRHTVPAFWDGGQTWRARFIPDEAGPWTYTTRCTPAGYRAARSARRFSCAPYEGDNPLYRHGAVGLSAHGTLWPTPMARRSSTWPIPSGSARCCPPPRSGSST